MFGLLVLCVCSLCIFFFLMIRRPPRSTRTDTLFPYTTLFRSNVTIDSLSRRSAIATFGIGAAAMTMNEASAQTPTAVRTAVPAFAGNHQVKPLRLDPARSEERRVGKECVRTCRSRWVPNHKNKNTIHNSDIYIHIQRDNN